MRIPSTTWNCIWKSEKTRKNCSTFFHLSSLTKVQKQLQLYSLTDTTPTPTPTSKILVFMAKRPLN